MPNPPFTPRRASCRLGITRSLVTFCGNTPRSPGSGGQGGTGSVADPSTRRGDGDAHEGGVTVSLSCCAWTAWAMIPMDGTTPVGMASQQRLGGRAAVGSAVSKGLRVLWSPNCRRWIGLSARGGGASRHSHAPSGRRSSAILTPAPRRLPRLLALCWRSLRAHKRSASICPPGTRAAGSHSPPQRG